MSFDANKLYGLLPSIYRIRDAEQGGPLKALLEVMAGQAAVLEEDLEQLYDDQFIETCADWVVPYLGDLIGYRSLHQAAQNAGSPRAEVANTIAYRRRKGTASMLEQLARDVTGFDARVVEFFQRLAATQFMNHVRPDNHYAPDLRRWETTEWLHTPFDTTARTVDVRRISTGRGRYNIPNVGLFLWRLQAQPLRDSPAFRVDDLRYLFSPLGNNAPLFTRPEAEETISHLAEPINVPMPLRRRILAKFLADYYGPGDKSLSIAGVSAEQLMVCCLEDTDDSGATWKNTPPPAGKVAIDPELGRIAFPEPLGGATSLSPQGRGDKDVAAPMEAPRVSFHYGFSADLGGGEYERAATFETGLELAAQVPASGDVQGALTAAVGGGAVEITDNGRCEQTLAIQVNAGRRLELRAANEHRPLIALTGDTEIRGGEDSEVILNGLLIAGGVLRVPSDAGNRLKRLVLRHCTLVPGLGLTIKGEAVQPDQPNLVVELDGVTVELDHCIVGALRVVGLSNVRITDSIVDATRPTGVAFASPVAVAPGAMPSAGGPLRLEESTIIGKVHTALLELASNSIFFARLAESGETWPTPIRSAQKQAGCVRFCALPWESQTPRRYRCQPDLEIARRIEEAEQRARARHRTLPTAEREAVRNAVRAWLRPAFTSTRYGQAAYGQLSLGCPREIVSGAEDESEMGVFHDLLVPQREANLCLRLAEYLRFGLEAGIFYAT